MSISACGNSDLTVTSDLGEKIIIKESAVTKLPFDSKEARDEASATMSRVVNGTDECASRSFVNNYLLTQGDCWDIHNAGSKYGHLEKYRFTLEAPIETHVLACVGRCQ